MQGLLRMTKDYYREPVKVVRLWVHECERVLADRMINDTDMTKFNEFRVTVTKKYFDEVNQASEIVCHHLFLIYRDGNCLSAIACPVCSPMHAHLSSCKCRHDRCNAEVRYARPHEGHDCTAVPVSAWLSLPCQASRRCILMLHPAKPTPTHLTRTCISR